MWGVKTGKRKKIFFSSLWRRGRDLHTPPLKPRFCRLSVCLTACPVCTSIMHSHSVGKHVKVRCDWPRTFLRPIFSLFFFSSQFSFYSAFIVMTMKDLLTQIVLDPKYHDLLSIVKGFRSGVVYGAKVRFPHALVMTILFKTGS